MNRKRFRFKHYSAEYKLQSVVPYRDFLQEKKLTCRAQWWSERQIPAAFQSISKNEEKNFGRFGCANSYVLLLELKNKKKCFLQ